ncbi:hypothetical protein AB833_06855 [Chromatiales bacterium (ex Bugula neritina AB1)]|nr:hypothetical protein AB833_06855 [Chromatiales bacterium (ex Bugula neritina AB1)]
MSMHERNFSVSTSSAAAAAACSRAVEKFTQRKIDVVPCLQEALAADPDCGFAHAVSGLMLHGARQSSLMPLIEDSLAAAKRLRASMNHREQAYVDALECGAAGNLHGMVDHYEKILAAHPTDILALVLCQGELFWLGEMQRSERASSMVASAWHEETPGYPDYLAVRAFDLEECGQYSKAEACGREAVEQRSSNAWAAHAVAHVMLMQRRSKEGVDWLEGLQNNWQETNQMKFHIWWHQCLFYLETRQHDAVLDGYDNWIRNRNEPLVQVTPDLYIDLQNGASMLWRLEHAGVAVGSRWQEMAELVEKRLLDMSSPFTSAHYAVILAAVGNYKACDTLIEAMRDFASASPATLAERYRVAAIPAAEAAVAHRRGQYQNVLDSLLPVRQALWQMGASHAQRDLFFQMLVDAAARSGKTDLVQSLLQEIELIGFVEPAQRVAYASAVSQVDSARS